MPREKPESHRLSVQTGPIPAKIPLAIPEQAVVTRSNPPLAPYPVQTPPPLRRHSRHGHFTTVSVLEAALLALSNLTGNATAPDGAVPRFVPSHPCSVTSTFSA